MTEYYSKYHRALTDKSVFAISWELVPSRGAVEKALEEVIRSAEQAGKAITNDCLHCGDCGLPDVAYICPTSQCPKGQRNGPCGGSYLGWCEVHPNTKKCIYVRAYPRLKHYGEEDQLVVHQVPPVDYDLRQSSSWLSFYMGRDHTAKRLGIEPPKPKQPKKQKE